MYLAEVAVSMHNEHTSMLSIGDPQLLSGEDPVIAIFLA